MEDAGRKFKRANKAYVGGCYSGGCSKVAPEAFCVCACADSWYLMSVLCATCFCVFVMPVVVYQALLPPSPPGTAVCRSLRQATTGGQWPVKCDQHDRSKLSINGHRTVKDTEIQSCDFKDEKRKIKKATLTSDPTVKFRGRSAIQTQKRNESDGTESILKTLKTHKKRLSS